MRRGLWAWCSLMMCAGWMEAAAVTVVEWSSALAQARVQVAEVKAAGRSLAIGPLTLSVRTGSLRPVVARDTVVGAYFNGEATLAYKQADSFAEPVFRTNVKRLTSGTVDDSGAYVDTVTSALILASPGGVRMLFPNPPALGEAEPMEGHRARFAHLRGPRYPTVLAQAMVDPPAQPLYIAEIVGKGEDYLFTYDTVRDHVASLAVLVKSSWAFRPLSQWRFALPLAVEPVGRAWLAPRPKPFMLTDVDLTLVNPRGRTAQLSVTETFTALTPTRVLALSLWSDRVVEAGGSGSQEVESYTLTSVRTEAGEALPFVHASGDLVVELPGTLQPGGTTTVQFEIQGEVLYRPEGMSFWELPTSNWLPVPDRLDLQYFTYHAVVKAASPFTPFSCGRTVRRWQEEGLECAEFREERPIHIPVVLAGKYKTLEREHKGVKIRVSRYVMAEERSMQQIASIISALLDFYEPYLGAYPFAELNIIEINSYGFGQAPAGIIFITKEAFSPLQDVMARLFSQGINARLAHEMAHTWWGHVAKLGEPEDQWLSESTAEYMAAYAMGKLWKKQEFDTQLRRWRSNSKFVKDKGTVYLANHLSGDSGFEDRVGLLYNKGPLVLHALRQQLGDDQFFTVLKSFVRSFDFRFAETQHFLGITDFVTKKEMRPFFDRYLLGTEWPAETRGGASRQ